MSKVDILRLDSVTTNDTRATALINTNFSNIQTVIDTLLSRTNETPNYMDTVLDMNSQKIINTAMPTEDFDVVNLKYLRDYSGNVESLVADATAAAEAALEKANNAAASATSSAAFAQTAQAAAAQAAQDAIDAAADADRIQRYVEDPNLIAVGEDLTSPDSYIKSVMEAAGDIESKLDDIAAAEGYARDASNSASDASDSASAAKQWAIGDPSEPAGNSAKYWAEQAQQSIVYLPSLFSFQWSDHLFNNVSWLRADTFSWQDGTVYSEAYDKLVEEYSTGTLEFVYKPWTQPVLSANGTMGGDSFAVSATSSYSSRQPYMAFDGNSATKWGIDNSSATESLIFYNPVPLKVKKITQTVSSDYPSEDYGIYSLYGSYSGQDGTWLLIANAQDVAANTEVEYVVSNPRAFSYYKIEISGSHNNYSGIGDLIIDAEEALFPYKHTSNGFNIVDSAYATDVADLYDSTGVAWYYILDLVNHRFKLPRTKYGFTGLRDSVGSYVEPGLPNITGSFSCAGMSIGGQGYTATGALTGSSNSYAGSDGYGANATGIGFDASESNAIYGNSSTVQPPATQMYLYFYVGQFSQSAIEQTAGLNSELFNDKLDLDLGNITNASKEEITSWGMPDYSAGVDITASVANGYTATSNLWINALCEKHASQNSTATITINNTEYDVAYTSNNNQWQESNTVSLLLSNGDTLKTNSTNANWTITAFPLKGN